jgi:hypothetical protein
MAANPLGALKYAMDPSTTPLLETTLENYRDDMRGMHTPMGSVIGMNPYSFRSYLGEQAHEKQLGRPNLYDHLVQNDPLALAGLVAGRGRLNLNRGMPVLNQVTGEVDFGTQTLFPNRLTQSILNRRRSGAAASGESAAAEEAFLAEGMGEATIARGPGAAGSTSIPKQQPTDIYGELGKQREGTSWRLLRNQPNLSARQVKADADVDQVFYDQDGNMLQGDAFEQARAKYQAAQRYQQNVLEAHKDQYQYEGNVQQLSSLLHGSKLEHSVGKDGSIQVSQVQALIDKGQLSGPEAQNLQEALNLSVQDQAEYMGQATVDRVDYAVLKRNASALADPFELVRKPTKIGSDGFGDESLVHDSYQNYGVDNLFLPQHGMIGRGETHKTIDYGPDLDEILETTETNLITTDVPELRNTVKGHFGKEVTGHYRTFRMPGEPDVLYITEMQADPLQARKEEYTGPNGEEVKTRQLSVAGGRRYDDKLRDLQKDNAVSLHNGLADFNMQILGYKPTLLDPTPSTVTTEKRRQRVDVLQSAFRNIKQTTGNNYDHRMQEQMRQQGGIQGFHDIPQSTGPRARNIFGAPENEELEAISDRLTQVRSALNDMHMNYQIAEDVGRPVAPRVQAVIDSQNEFIAKEINDLQQIVRDVQDNVMLFNETLKAGYNGKLTPLQAKMVKDQDKFLVGKILQAEADGASVIRFPRGETVRKIQGYGNMQDVLEEAQDNMSSIYSDIENNKEFANDVNPSVFAYAPEGQTNRILDMDPEEFVDWHKNYEIEKRIGDARGKREAAKIEEMTKSLVDERMASLKSEALDDGVIYLDPAGQIRVTDQEALLKMFHKRELLARSTSREAAIQAIQGDSRAMLNVYLMQMDMTNDYLANLRDNYERLGQTQEHLNTVQNQGGDDELLAQQAIMDGYERMTKAFDKHKLTYREVMDEYGNGWYEVDVPANFNAKAGEVRAYRIGGRVPMKIKKKKAFNLVKQ